MATTATVPQRRISILTKPTFTAAQRIKIQQEIIQRKDYRVIGRLTAVLFEAQRNLSGFSQSRPRYNNPLQVEALRGKDHLKPFSEGQAVLWQSVSLDWLNGKRGPMLAISNDRRDILLPQGLTPLPDIPDPRWVPGHAQQVCPNPRAIPRGDGVIMGCSFCVAPRIPQLLTGCPIVGDRVRDKITTRDGHVWGVLHPVTVLSVMVSGIDGKGHFANIKGGVNQSDGTHLALLLDDENRAYFVGGTFSV